MSYRVIALDLDGTLLNPQKHILQESIDVLNEARRAGVKVLIVTGRHHVAIHPFYQTLALDTPAICCNGTYLYDYNNKKVLESNPLTREESHQLLARLQPTDIHHLIYADDVMLYDQLTSTVERSLQWSSTLPEHQRPNLQKVDNFSTVIDDVHSIWKFATSTEDLAKLQQFTDVVEDELGLACEWSWIDQVDITKKGNSKGNRLKSWVESQGLTMKDVIAFGDNMNDVSMLSTAGLGVAMGNASDEVKAQADIVTLENTQPGIAQVIRQYVL